MKIRPAHADDTAAVLEVERIAFDGDAEAALVSALLIDPTAHPLVNLVAEDDGRVVGHVLLTTAGIEGPPCAISAMLLAPLAVAPAAQGEGLGTMLCEAAIDAARDAGVGLLFVLGYPTYYSRVGFEPALPLGFEAPYPIDPAVSDAWMVMELAPGVAGSVRGRVRCADALMHPELWAE